MVYEKFFYMKYAKKMLYGAREKRLYKKSIWCMRKKLVWCMKIYCLIALHHDQVQAKCAL